MQIAIIGAGNVGSGIARGWAAKGHGIRFGLRDPGAEKYRPLATTGALLRPAEAVAGAAAVLLATPWPQAETAIASLGDLTGKLLLDATNPLAMGPDGLGLAIGHTESGGERVASWAEGAATFKTLNTTGFEVLGNAHGYPLPPVMFVAGDDPARKPTVLGLVADLGFAPIDAGPLRNARLLEAHAMLWIDLALQRGQGRDFAFGLMRRG
jgi:predicted dinucleotide-binding enzyme